MTEKSRITFWFIVDVSGSMYGENIASVHASLAECMNELKAPNAIADKEIYVKILTFSDTLEVLNEGEEIKDFVLPQFIVKEDEDGFYSVTSYKCLYEGIYHLLAEDSEKDYYFLLTDGKVIDTDEYEEALERIQNCLAYKNAEKYVALVGTENHMIDNDIMKFVDFKGDRIAELGQLSDVISKLRRMYSNNNQYDEIFN